MPKLHKNAIISVSTRVSLKYISSDYGTVVQASAKGEWLIKWDNPMKTDSVQKGSTLLVHPPGTGLVKSSPADGEDGSNDVALINDDPEEVEDGNPMLEPEDLNTTQQKRQRFEAKRQYWRRGSFLSQQRWVVHAQHPFFKIHDLSPI